MTALACVRIPNIAIALARRADPALSDQPLVLYSREGAPGRLCGIRQLGCYAWDGTPSSAAGLPCPDLPPSQSSARMAARRRAGQAFGSAQSARRAGHTA